MLFDQFPGLSGVVDDCLDLTAMTYYALILEQSVDVGLGEAGYPIEVEVVKGGTKMP